MTEGEAIDRFHALTGDVRNALKPLGRQVRDELRAHLARGASPESQVSSGARDASGLDLRRSEVVSILSKIGELTALMKSEDFAPVAREFAESTPMDVSDVRFFDAHLDPFGEGPSREKSVVNSAEGPLRLEHLESGEEIHAASVFVQMQGIKTYDDPLLLPSLMAALHTVVSDIKGYVLSTLTGLIVVIPDRSQTSTLAAVEQILKRWRFAVPLKIGVSHGKLDVVVDVDGRRNLIGRSINLAARLAFAKINEQCLVHESFARHLDNQLRPEHWLHRRRRALLIAKGKEQDGDIPCFAMPPVLGAVVDREATPIETLRPSVIIAYDLPKFSAGSPDQLRSRFQGMTHLFDRIRSNSLLREREMLLAPGGDGGIAVFSHDMVRVSDAIGIAKALYDLSRAESHDRAEAISLHARIAVHYGQVTTYQNVYGESRPVGRDLFIADELAGDEIARKHEGVVFTDQTIDGVTGGNEKALADRFIKLDGFEPASVAFGISRYVPRNP